MRTIDADKLYPDCMTKNGTLAISQSQIANAPTVERPHGKWIYTPPDIKKGVVGSCYCSKCGGVGYTTLNFCPECGADMRKEVDDDN